jgi:dihydroxyacid dehydratase/phosphogluconate dehydratase
MEDLHAVGGTPGVMKYMLEHGMLHGHCMHGARFSAEIYTRGCHWIPRMFA